MNRNTHQRKLDKIKSRHNKQVNIFIGEKLKPHIEKLFFQREWDDGSFTLHYTGDPWLSGIMRDIGIFSSTADAKGAGWHRKAGDGFWNDIVIVRKIPHNICIYKEKKEKIKPTANLIAIK